MDKNEKISYAKTVYGHEEIEAVLKCLSESTQMGNYSKKFEKQIAELFNKKHCLYTNSGSSALYIELKLLNFLRIRNNNSSTHIFNVSWMYCKK